MKFLTSLYAHIGRKIKNLAIASFIVEAIGAVITGIILLVDSGFEEGWWAIFIILCGPIVAFVGSWLLYGLGEIIDKLSEIERNTGLAYKPDAVKEIYVQEERSKYEAEEQAKINEIERLKREEQLRKEREFAEQKKREEREAAEQKKRAEREADEQLRRDHDKGIPTPIRLNRFGEATCPRCSRDLDANEKNNAQKCPKCGFLYTITR